jgi:transcriptional regulator with XRE-family HTH domain
MENPKPVHPFQKIRRKHSLTQSQMGQLLKILPNRVAQIECGYQPLTDRIFAKIAEVFKIDAKQLDKDLKEYEKAIHTYLLSKIN